MVKITYLHHSGFAVELDRVVLLFDVISEVPEEVLGTGKPMIFVVTHGHHDHYDSSIFRLRELGVPIRYIISDDIELPRADDITMIKPDERLVVRLSSKNELIFRTFGSTDRGISNGGEPSRPTCSRIGPSIGTIVLVPKSTLSPDRPPKK